MAVNIGNTPLLRLARIGPVLTPQKTILDASWGKTATAYSMIGAARGYRVMLCVPANVWLERAMMQTGKRGQPRQQAERLFTSRAGYSLRSEM